VSPVDCPVEAVPVFPATEVSAMAANRN